jgi:hypothetical protein
VSDAHAADVGTSAVDVDAVDADSLLLHSVQNPSAKRTKTIPIATDLTLPSHGILARFAA